jgi:hypothetical protein
VELLEKKLCNENGIVDQLSKLRTNVMIGARIKLKTLELFGITVSFNSNFKPSARGCNKPIKPTKFGPFLF